MNLEQFGEELKQARLNNKISLMDISAETRINLKFLDAIERGQFHILPQTYVRAFLREYALMLNLDPNDILQRYDDTRQDVSPRKSDDVVPQHSSKQEKISIGKLTERLVSLSPLQRNIALGTFIIAAVALIIVLANINMGPNSQKSIEVPFDHVIRESEATSIPPPSTPINFVPVINPPQNDSLRLEITTIDSVWISLLIDGKKSEAYLFGENRKRAWAAKERFVITMGNAGGATFQLNGKDLGTLGKLGAVVRNMVITEANLKN